MVGFGGAVAGSRASWEGTRVSPTPAMGTPLALAVLRDAQGYLERAMVSFLLLKKRAII